VKFVTRDVNNAGAGALLTWELPLTVQAAADQPGLVDVAKQAGSGRGRYAADVLATLITPSASEATLSAAGEIALLARHWEDARSLFMRVLASNDKSARARLGLASAALMARDYDAGTKLLWAARDSAASNVKPALSAAIGDLQQIVATR
jgi:thioredoxin-like negative regulator of GroEL